jgi:hypothetical protein
MGEPSVGTPPSERPLEDRLDSWKEIAAYLKRDVTTVQRWEKREGMPSTGTCMTGWVRSTRPERTWMRGCAAGILE